MPGCHNLTNEVALGIPCFIYSVLVSMVIMLPQACGPELVTLTLKSGSGSIFLA